MSAAANAMHCNTFYLHNFFFQDKKILGCIEYENKLFSIDEKYFHFNLKQNEFF